MVALLNEGYELPIAVIEACPQPWKHSMHDRQNEALRDHIQCAFLIYVLENKAMPLGRINEIWYPNGVFDETLHWCPTDRPRYLSLYQRYAIQTLFYKQLNAGNVYSAACTLTDKRLRPSQPKRMLQELLRVITRITDRNDLSKDPQESPRNALRVACAAFTAMRAPTITSMTAARMLQFLAASRLDQAVKDWIGLMQRCRFDQLDNMHLGHITRYLCRNSASAEAYTFVMNLPLKWRHRSMYPALLSHFSDIMLNKDGSLDPQDQSRSATVWRAATSLPNQEKGTIALWLARLGSHATYKRASHALRDEYIIRQLGGFDPRALRQISFLTVCTLVRAGRWSLASRYVHRYVRKRKAPPNAFRWLNVLLIGIVTHPKATSHVTAREMVNVITNLLQDSQASNKLLPTKNALQLLADQAHDTHLSPDYTKLPLVHQPSAASVIQLAHVLKAEGNLRSQLLLGRWIIQSMDNLSTPALWEMIQNLLPLEELHELAPPYLEHTIALFQDLGAVFKRRDDRRSAHQAQYLGRQCLRRIIGEGNKAFVRPHDRPQYGKPPQNYSP
ncbi:hypothetical protein MYAM1_002596 [Malassezia yamatoensis]|uniref:Uncharacterized protein n=1 Tax=Malassezia yamatoensis TaxID=253288 RepID=A0AAJ6CI31_9BASI|nr:hypothetical protein MYAM1_002596 [Malassezia yamatoensis]